MNYHYICNSIFILMYDSLFTYIKDRSKAPLSEKEVELIKRIFVPKKIRKKQYLLQAGEICKYTAFIIKGAMRQYRVDDKGLEHIIRLSLETWWAVDRESFTMLVPSVYNIDACEDTDVLTVTKSDSEILNSIPAWVQTRTRMDENYSFA